MERSIKCVFFDSRTEGCVFNGTKRPSLARKGREPFKWGGESRFSTGFLGEDFQFTRVVCEGTLLSGMRGLCQRNCSEYIPLSPNPKPDAASI